MKVFLLIISLFFFKLSAAQLFLHTREAGLKGNIKKIVEYRYSRLRSSYNHYEPRDISNWDFKYISEFDKEGNLERYTIMTNLAGSHKIQTVVIKFYRNSGSVTGTCYSEEGRLFANIKLLQKNKTNYLVSSFDSSGKLISQADRSLTDSLNIKSFSFKVYNTEDSIVRDEKVNYIMDKKNRLWFSIMNNLKTNKKSRTYYFYIRFDKNHNPIETHLSEMRQYYPRLIIMAEYEYYS